MKNLIKLLLVVFVLIAFGCQQQHDLEELKSKIDNINQKLETSILDEDHESVFALYTEDAISLPSYEPMIKGLAAMKAKIENEPDMPGAMKAFTLQSLEVWASGNFVVDIGTYELVMDMPQGEWKDNGKYLTLFEIQKDGSLLMKADTWNTDINPWEAMMDSGEMQESKN